MKWSLKIGRFAGVDVFVHWTFLLLLAWIFFGQIGAGNDTAAALLAVGFILALFGCVVLHEFGHALAARRYGIHTRDITLLPIGGVARLERMPEDPRHELWVALAGPLVNVVISAALAAYLLIDGSAQSIAQRAVAGEFVPRLLTVNLFLAFFNLLPAFPMDGGRVLRALLATRMGRRRATQVAANVGQAMAILFGVYGFFGNPLMIFIAIFVYIGAQGEAQAVELTSVIRGMTVRDGMQTRFRVLSADDLLSVAVAELLAGSQHDFPVVRDGAIVGMLRRQDLVKALAEHGANASVGSAMCHECQKVDAGESLEQAFERLHQSNCAVAPAMEDGRIVGLLTLENLSELVMVNTALERRRETRVA